MQSRRFAVVVTIVIVVAFVVVAVAPAFAAAPASLVTHARLASSVPEDGATVTAPREVVLTFSEDVNPNFVEVEVGGAHGDETDGEPATDARTVTQQLVTGLPAGEHTVTYRVVSADGHPVAGTVTFTTTAAAASPSPSATVSAAAPGAPTASAVASPQPSVSAVPTSSGSDGGGTRWLVVLGVVALAVLGLGAAWRTIGGSRADAEAGAADAAERATTTDPDPADSGRTPTA